MHLYYKCWNVQIPRICTFILVHKPNRADVHKTRPKLNRQCGRLTLSIFFFLYCIGYFHFLVFLLSFLCVYLGFLLMWLLACSQGTIIRAKLWMKRERGLTWLNQKGQLKMCFTPVKMLNERICHQLEQDVGWRWVARSGWKWSNTLWSFSGENYA